MVWILTLTLLSWTPFGVKMFNLSDPPIGVFRTENHMYVVSHNGTVYKISFKPDITDFAEISDSFKLPLTKIVPGRRGKSGNFKVHNIVYWRKRLVVLTDYGVYVSDTGEDFRKWKPITMGRAVEIAGDSENLFILFPQKVVRVIERNGEHSIENVAKVNLTEPCFSSFIDGTLFFESSDTLCIVSGDSLKRFALPEPKGNVVKYNVLVEFIVRKHYPDIFGNGKFVARDSSSGYTVAYIGSYEEKGRENPRAFSHYLVLDSSFNAVDTFSIPDFEHTDVIFNEGYFWIMGIKSIFGGALYGLRGNPPVLKDSFSTKLMSLTGIPSDKGINFATYVPSFVAIFQNEAPEHLYSSFIEFPEIFWFSKKLPFLHDGPSDFVMFSSSFNPTLTFDERNNGIVLLVPRIDEALGYAASLVSWAKRHQHIWSAGKALDSLDAAMEIYRVLKPDTLAHLFKLRESLYRQVKLIKFVKTNWLKSLLAVIWVLTVLMFLRAKRTFRKFRYQYAPLPSEETIKGVMRIPIFHKFPSLWQPIVENHGFDCDVLKDENLYKNLQESLRMLVAMEKDFRNVHPRWESLFKRTKWNLLLLSNIFSLHRLCRLGGIFKNLLKRSTVSLLRHIANVRNELKSMLEKERADIIQGALLPVVEDIRKNYAAQGVIVNTEITQQASYAFYPSELAKFQCCFKAILENAIESYTDGNTIKKIDIKVRALPDVLEISIRDYGKGLPPQMISKIFEPGFSYGKQGKERGYGLAGCDELFRKHGEIEVKSEPNKGTSFNIKIYFLPKRRR